jgi:multiple sugar transport system ATP-binding protein
MNFLPGRLEGETVKTAIGDIPLSGKLRSGIQGDGGGSRDVIVGMRPEHFEDAAVEQEEHADRMKFRTRVDVVESMGSELYVYFDVKTEEIHTADLDELAADAGMEDLPSHGDGQQVVARLSAESRAQPGGEVELSLDTTGVMLFATDNGRSLTAAA